MDRSRYEGYVAAKDAVSAQVTDPFAAEVLSDLGEGLLLSRDDAEARQAQAQVIEAFGLLVDPGDLAGNIAGRLWVHLRACGPEMHWPPRWDHVRATPIGPAMRGH